MFPVCCPDETSSTFTSLPPRPTRVASSLKKGACCCCAASAAPVAATQQAHVPARPHWVDHLAPTRRAAREASCPGEDVGQQPRRLVPVAPARVVVALGAEAASSLRQERATRVGPHSSNGRHHTGHCFTQHKPAAHGAAQRLTPQQHPCCSAPRPRSPRRRAPSSSPARIPPAPPRPGRARCRRRGTAGGTPGWVWECEATQRGDSSVSVRGAEARSPVWGPRWVA